MNKLLACVLTVALSTGILLADAFAQSSLQPLDRIAAVVNEDVILRSELDRALRNIKGQYADRPGQLPPQDVLERQVIERLVLVRLQVARADESGVSVSDEEVDAAVANVAGQNQLSVDQLQQQLVRDGMTLADFRNTMRDEILTQRLRQSFARSRIVVSDAEVDAALASQGAAGTQYRLGHILVALPEGATPGQIGIGHEKIEGIKGLIDKGELDFSAAAVRYSDSPNALEGGDLGWRSVEEIPSAFIETLKGMQVGQVIGPIRGPSGFQLLKLVETRDAAQAQPGKVTQYQARHILVRSDEDTSDAEAKARIDTLAARLAGGAEFAELAIESSDDTASRAKGGDLGWLAEDTYGVEFGAQVAALADGQVSAPFKTPTGWHIVERIGSRQVAIADENRRSAMRETIGQRKLEDEWNRFLRELRGEAYVDIRGSVAADTPAAPTAPATAPPAGG